MRTLIAILALVAGAALLAPFAAHPAATGSLGDALRIVLAGGVFTITLAVYIVD